MVRNIEDPSAERIAPFVPEVSLQNPQNSYVGDLVSFKYTFGEKKTFASSSKVESVLDMFFFYISSPLRCHLRIL